MQSDINKLLRNIITGGLFIVPFIPFIISSSLFFPFISGKNFAFRILIEILFALWAILVVFDRNYLPKKNEILASIMVFVGVIAVADFLGVNQYKSFWSNFERMEGFISLIHLFAYFILLISVFTEKAWKYYFTTFVCTGLGLIGYGALQLMGVLAINQGGVRLDATFGNATYFAVHMLFVAFISAFMLVRGKVGNNFRTWFFGSVSLLSVVMLIETATRGTALGLIAGILLVSGILFVKGEGALRENAKRVLIAMAVLFIVFLGVRRMDFVVNSPILGRFAELNLKSVMNQPRYMVWGSAWKGFTENPILGWGQEGFNYVFNKYYNPGMYSQEPWFDRAHNVFFDWLIAGGILGLLSYLSIFFFSIKALWKNGVERFTLAEKSVITGLFSGYFIHNIFVFDNLMSYIMFFTMIAFIYSGTKEASEGVVPRSVSYGDNEFKNYLSISLVIVALFFGLYFANLKPIMASMSLIDALSNRSMSAADLEDSLKNFKKVFAYKTFATTEAREQLVQRAMSMARSQDVDMMTKQNFFQTAKDEMAKQIEKYPADARYRIFQGALYSAYGLYGDALNEYTIASDLSPKKQTILFELVGAYINSGEGAKALEIARKAYESEPNYDEALNIYAIAAIYSGNDELAKDLLVKKYGTDVVADDRLINAYAATQNYEKVIEIWQKRIAAEPTNAQYHIYLSASYLANKQTSKSIAELEKAAELNPALKAQVDAYIKEIRAGRTPR